jgi:hypothetical protein
MKLRQSSLAYKGSFLASTLFFMGIVVSAYSLFVIQGSHTIMDFKMACTAIGTTFLFGALAINLLASNKEVKVVYIEKQTDGAQAEQTVELDEASQLDVNEIEKILEGPYDSLQGALNEICNQLQAGQGAIYIAHDHQLDLKYGYALSIDRQTAIRYELGEGLVGRVAAQKQMLYIDKLPEDYITVYSGLGSASPSFLVLIPIVNGKKVEGVLEVSTFQALNEMTLEKLKNITEILAGAMHKENMVEYA